MRIQTPIRLPKPQEPKAQCWAGHITEACGYGPCGRTTSSAYIHRQGIVYRACDPHTDAQYWGSLTVMLWQPAKAQCCAELLRSTG